MPAGQGQTRACSSAFVGDDTGSAERRDSGDWVCACGFHNFSFRSECFHCGQHNPERPAAQAPLKTAPSHRLGSAGFTGEPTDSEHHHFAADRFHTTSISAQPYKNGDWTCQCGTHNFARRTACITCLQPRTAATATAFYRAVDKSLPPATDAESGPSRLSHREGGGAAQPASRYALRPGDWICPTCLAHNFRSRDACFGCGQGRPATARAERVGGEWVCGSCHTTNFAGAGHCAVCGAAAAGGQEQAHHELGNKLSSTSGSRSRDRFVIPPEQSQAGDWSCRMCGFHNFASRVKCRACKANQPALDPSPSPTGETTECGESQAWKEEDRLGGWSGGDVDSGARGGREGGQTMWICECGYKNYATRDTCRECGDRKPLLA